MSVINDHIKSKFEKTIGTGTISQSKYPTYEYYDYGYFGQIYTNLELGVGQPVWITGVRFHMVGDSVDDKTSVNQTLKLGQVNSSEFATNIQNGMIQQPFAGWSVSNLTTVKSNFIWTVIEDYNDWLEITLDTPFQYDPTISNSNLLLLWENRDGSYLSNSLTPSSKCSTSGSLYRSYYSFSDGSMPSITAYGTRDNTGRPNIELIIKV